MSSTSNSNGSATITITFKTGTDIDKAQMDVQNKLALVEQRLPEQVRRQGIPVQKANSGFLLLIAVGSNSGRTGALELGNFANARVVDELRHVPGVGNVQVFASRSEEHTSELQSLMRISYAVFCLKTNISLYINTHISY